MRVVSEQAVALPKDMTFECDTEIDASWCVREAVVIKRRRKYQLFLNEWFKSSKEST